MITLYQASIPMMIKSLHNLSGLITKASQHCASQNIKPEDILSFRLFEDMRPLAFQVQSCSNTAKGLAVRVGGMEDIFLEDNESTFAELQDRTTRTIEILSSLDPHCMDDKDDKEILMKASAGRNFQFVGYDYVIKYAVPNFHFHLGTAYCILRHMGVPLSAVDYLDAQNDLFVRT